MFWCFSLLSFLLLGDANCDVSKSRVRRQGLSQNGQVIDDIFNIPITAIRQTAAIAQVFSPENTQTIDTVFKVPVSTLEAVGTLVKSTAERRQQNAETIQKNRQERRDRLLARREQKWKRKEEVQNQRLPQQQVKRVVRHHKDPLGLDALTDLLIGHHSLLSGHHGLFGGHHSGGHHSGGHHSGSGGSHGHHGGHGHRKKGHGSHGGHGNTGNQQHHTYEVHEDVNEDTSFCWHGLTAGFGSFHGTRPSSSSTIFKIENKVAPKEKKEKTSKYSSDDINPYDKITKTKNKVEREDDYPPLENKIAPRTGKVTFV